MISLAGGDITKADYILFEESYANLVLYASAMPRYDDIEKNKDTKSEPTIPRSGERMNFGQFLDAMAAIKEQNGN